MSEHVIKSIEAISYDRYGIKCEGVWYNARTDDTKATLKTLAKGDNIEMSANDKREFTHLAKVTGGAPSQPASTGNGNGYAGRDIKIVRQNSLTNAVNFYSAFNQRHQPMDFDTADKQKEQPNMLGEADEIILLAEKFEAWVNRE